MTFDGRSQVPAQGLCTCDCAKAVNAYLTRARQGRKAGGE